MYRNIVLTLDVVHGMRKVDAAAKYQISHGRVEQIVRTTCRKARVDRWGDPALIALALRRFVRATPAPDTPEAFYYQPAPLRFPTMHTPESFHHELARERGLRPT